VYGKTEKIGVGRLLMAGKSIGKRRAGFGEWKIVFPEMMSGPIDFSSEEGIVLTRFGFFSRFVSQI
jgi:hypothetical protein